MSDLFRHSSRTAKPAMKIDSTRRVVLALAAMFLLSAVALPQDAPTKKADPTWKTDINWAPDLDAARARAKAADKPVMIVFSVNYMGNPNLVDC